MKSEVFEVKALIDKLKAADKKFRVFGSDSHRYQIGPPLFETELSGFEMLHGITLPEDFRLYLQLVGDGSGRKPRPRPYNASWQVAGAGPGYGIYPLSDAGSGGQVHLPFPLSMETELSDDDWVDDVPGAIEICTWGCTTHVHLIVAGPESGKIWEGNDYCHFIPTDLSFIGWMRRWAETGLATV